MRYFFYYYWEHLRFIKWGVEIYSFVALSFAVSVIALILNASRVARAAQAVAWSGFVLYLCILPVYRSFTDSDIQRMFSDGREPVFLFALILFGGLLSFVSMALFLNLPMVYYFCGGRRWRMNRKGILGCALCVAALFAIETLRYNLRVMHFVGYDVESRLSDAPKNE